MQTWRAKFCIVQPHFICCFCKKNWKSPYLRPISFFKKYLQMNKKTLTFLKLFSFIFCIVKIDYFFNVLPIYERFQIWFLHEFFIIFYQKESFFVKNWQFLILFSIDSRFLAPNSWEKILWTSEHHFWEVHFFVTKMKFQMQKTRNIIYVSNQIIHCKTMIWKKLCFSFFAFKISFWSKNGLLKTDVWKSIAPLLKNLERKNDYQC